MKKLKINLNWIKENDSSAFSSPKNIHFSTHQIVEGQMPNLNGVVFHQITFSSIWLPSTSHILLCHCKLCCYIFLKTPAMGLQQPLVPRFFSRLLCVCNPVRGSLRHPQNFLGCTQDSAGHWGSALASMGPCGAVTTDLRINTHVPQASSSSHRFVWGVVPSATSGK